MQYFRTLFTFALAAVATVTVSAAAIEERAAARTLERRITDPGNPGNLINCPPNGGADACNLEIPVSPSSVILLATGPDELSIVLDHSAAASVSTTAVPRADTTSGGHIFCRFCYRRRILGRRVIFTECASLGLHRYNYDINDIPTGIEVGEEDSCTDY